MVSRQARDATEAVNRREGMPFNSTAERSAVKLRLTVSSAEDHQLNTERIS